MNPRHGIQVTVFLFVLVMAVFTALTVLLPDPNEESLPTVLNREGAVNMTDSQFAGWLNGSFANISVVVAQIQGSGMGMGNTSALDVQLRSLGDRYIGELENITVAPSAKHAQVEFMAALEDYREAAIQRMEQSGMGKMGQSMEYLLRASIHANSALQDMAHLTT